MPQVTYRELKAREAAGTHKLITVAYGQDAYDPMLWRVSETDRDGRTTYHRVFKSEAEARAHAQFRLAGGMQ